MDWDKAKNITILLFLILNIVLGILINEEKNNYILSTEQINMINSLLKKNNILYEDNLLIKKYKPMRQINASYENFDIENILNIFIKDIKNTEKCIEDDYLTFENNTEKLIIYDNKVIYKRKNKLNLDTKNNCNNIEEITNKIIKNINKKAKFIKDNTIYENNKVILEYREKYKKNIIYDNYILFKFDNKNLEYVEYCYNNINSYLNKQREIVSLDVIILTFIQKIKNICDNNNIKIEKIDIVYSKRDINFIDNKNIIMVPFYRIRYKLNYKEKDIYFIMINAYTNVVY